MKAAVNDFLHSGFVTVFLIQNSKKREQAHLHLLWQRKTCGMIQCDLAAVCHHAVNTGFTLVEDPLRAGYYSEIDMLVWAKKFYGDDFVAYLQKTYNPLDVVFRLANETSLVLLNGGGFAGPKWSVRVSLANLNEADYVKIGQSIKRVLEEYANVWKASIR